MKIFFLLIAVYLGGDPAQTELRTIGKFGQYGLCQSELQEAVKIAKKQGERWYFKCEPVEPPAEA